MCTQGSLHQGAGEEGLTCTRTRLCEDIFPGDKDIFPATCRGSNGAKGKDRTATCEILPPYSPLPPQGSAPHFAPSHTTPQVTKCPFESIIILFLEWVIRRPIA